MKQLLTYSSLAYLFSWIIWFPLYGHILGFHNLPTVPYHHALGGLGPMIAAIITTRIFQKKKGLKLLLTRSIQVKPLIYLGIAVLSPFILVVVATFISAILKGTRFELTGMTSTSEFPGFSLPEFFIYNLVFFGYGEEVGWRGFALPRLQATMNALAATVILTILWAL